MSTPNALFVSDKKYLGSDIMGGVQLCTREYIRYLNSAGVDCRLFGVAPKISLATRIKIKMNIDAYDRYSIEPYLQQLTDTINTDGIKLVFLNQLSLAVWAAELRKHVANDVKFIGLSHGNESADYVHEVTRGGSAGKLQTYKLGKLLAREAKIFSVMLDGIVVLSEQEAAINQWLGAKKVLYLPRLLSPAYIDHRPVTPNAGFAGTLDHLPNRLGIELLAKKLAGLNFNHRLRIVGGPENIGRKLSSDYNFIDYIGPVSDKDLVDEVSRWSVFINPVFWYARGASTKLAQAINWGIPCITTPAGRRGYELSNSDIITKDDSPASFAEKLIKVLDTPAELAKLQHAARQNAELFDAKPYIAALANLLAAIRISN